MSRPIVASVEGLYAERKRGDTYRARALALYNKLKHDGFTEKEAKSYIEMLQSHIWKMMDEAGIPREIEIDSFGKKYRAFDSFAGRLKKYGQLLTAEHARALAAEADAATLRALLKRTQTYSQKHEWACYSNHGDNKPCDCGVFQLWVEIDAALSARPAGPAAAGDGGRTGAGT